MITIRQALIDAPGFPRDQAWWSRFAPAWVAATARDDGTVTLEPSCRHYDCSAIGRDHDYPVARRDLTAAQRRQAMASIADWAYRLPRLHAGIVTEGTGQS